MEIREEDTRTALLLGEDGVEKLKHAKVAIFGVGGVGGAICEALARAGVGEIDLFDGDVFSLSNINRQIGALHSNVGKKKVDVWKERILDIHPTCRVNAYDVFYLPENADKYPLDGYDYVADAVDTVSAKIELAVRAQKANVALISAMGAGNKLNPEGFRVADLSKTAGCPLARVMRRELRARGILHLPVVFSPEEPTTPKNPLVNEETGKPIPGSLSFVTPIPGFLMAGKIVKDLLQQK